MQVLVSRKRYGLFLKKDCFVLIFFDAKIIKRKTTPLRKIPLGLHAVKTKTDVRSQRLKIR